MLFPRRRVGLHRSTFIPVPSNNTSGQPKYVYTDYPRSEAAMHVNGKPHTFRSQDHVAAIFEARFGKDPSMLRSYGPMVALKASDNSCGLRLALIGPRGILWLAERCRAWPEFVWHPHK
jgi:hypothetical protein